MEWIRIRDAFLAGEKINDEIVSEDCLRNAFYFIGLSKFYHSEAINQKYGEFYGNNDACLTYSKYPRGGYHFRLMPANEGPFMKNIISGKI